MAGLKNAAVLRNLAQLARITDEVQKTAMAMRMVPIGPLFQKMARLVGESSSLIVFPEGTRSFVVNVFDPDEGMYKGGRFRFDFKINQNFPHDPPKVKCTQKIYHPNIDLEGNVCLNILREDWKPVLNLNAVVVGLQFLFLEPNASDPLNKEAAEDLKQNREGFKRNVRASLGGGTVKGQSFDRVLK